MLPSRLVADLLGRIGFNMPGVYENNGMCQYDVTSRAICSPVMPGPGCYQVRSVLDRLAP